MNQLFYQIIYQDKINFVLRNINKLLQPVLPERIKLPPSGTVTIKNAEGKTLKIKTNQTCYLTMLTYWYGYEQFEYTKLFNKLVKKVGTFYDIGANIGYYSLLAALENPSIKVVSFEPAAGPLFYLRENVRLNNFDNIVVEPIALSHKVGEIDFYEIKNHKYAYLEHNLAGEGNTGSLTEGRNFKINTVKTNTLNGYVKANKEANIDLIKMDTEGTEHLILEQAGDVLSGMKPIVICETLFNTIEPELERIFSQYGYEFFNHTPAGLEKQQSIVRQIDNGVRNCFFVHPEKKHLIQEFIV